MKYGLVLLFAIVSVGASAAELAPRADGSAWPPVIGAWFWTQRDLEEDGFTFFLDAAALDSPYSLLTTSCRRMEVVEPQIHEQAAKAVRYARARGFQVAMEFDIRLARQAFFAKYPDEQQEELVLKFVHFTDEQPAEVVFQGVDTRDHMNGSLLPYECLATRLVRVYSFARDANGIDPATVQDISENGVSATTDGPRTLTVRIPSQPGRSVCVIGSHTYLTPDVFAAHLIEYQRGIIQQFADLPLSGIMKDEWGFPPDHTGNPAHDRYWYSSAMAKAYAECSDGADLVRDTLLLCAGEKGRERERQAAINRYRTICRQRNVAIEDDYYRVGKATFGKDAFIVTHATWTPYPGAQEFRKNGLSWWDATRDIGQTDESTPYPCRTSLAKRWGYPLWYNQFYAKETQPYLRELWQGALSGGRLNVHPLYPRRDLPLGERELLLLRSGLMAGMARLRMLDFITYAPIDCPVAVVFGHACAMNWAGPSYNRVGLEIASSLCREGYPTDLIPSSLVDSAHEGARRGSDSATLRIDEQGYVCLGPQRYRAIVLYQLEFCGESEQAFFRRAVNGKTAIFQVGPWTRDAEARPLETAKSLGNKVLRCEDDASCSDAVKRYLQLGDISRVTPWKQNNPTHPVPPVDGFTSLTDGTHIRAAGRENAAGDPIQETFSCNGHTVEVDCIGLVAIRFAPNGHIAALAAGGLKRLKTDGLDIELSQRADLAFIRNADETYAGVLQGWSGDITAQLLSITPHWQRLPSIPLPSNTAPD